MNKKDAVHRNSSENNHSNELQSEYLEHSAAARDQINNTSHSTCDLDWEPVKINKGEKLYQIDFCDNNGNVIDSPYFVDEKTFLECCEKDQDGNLIRDENGQYKFDVKKFCELEQIPPHIEIKADGHQQASYKNHVSCYVVNDQIDAEQGYAKQNAGYGEGGGYQVFVGNHEELKTNGTLAKDPDFKGIQPIADEERFFRGRNRDGLSEDEKNLTEDELRDLGALRANEMQDNNDKLRNEFIDKVLNERKEKSNEEAKMLPPGSMNDIVVKSEEDEKNKGLSEEEKGMSGIAPGVQSDDAKQQQTGVKQEDGSAHVTPEKKEEKPVSMEELGKTPTGGTGGTAGSGGGEKVEEDPKVTGAKKEEPEDMQNLGKNAVSSSGNTLQGHVVQEESGGHTNTVPPQNGGNKQTEKPMSEDESMDSIAPKTPTSNDAKQKNNGTKQDNANVKDGNDNTLTQ